MFFHKALLGLALAASVSVGSAQDIVQDVSIERFFGSEKYKAKNGGAQLSFTAVVFYWHISPDIKFLRKLKADASVSFYISADETVSPDDVLIYQKPVNGLKVIRPKLIKLKANLTQADKGKYILGAVTSPQSQIEENDVNSFYIAPEAY